MMKLPSLRKLSLLTGALMCLSMLHAQSSGGGVVVNPKGYGPGVKPAVVKPATPAVTKPAMPAVVKPATPAIVHPATPFPPGAGLPPGTIIVTPPGTGYPSTGVVTPVVPAYPSAWIGPTIIRESRSEPAPDPGTLSEGTSSTTTGMSSASVSASTLRLVAVVGSLKRSQLSSGADLGLAESSLGVSVGMMVGYGDGRPVRVSGDFFGTSWDGPGCFARSGDWNGGPFLNHPIMAVNEVSPGPWEFEAGMANQRVRWLRLAVSLFQDPSPDPSARPVNLPRGRRAAMREVLHRVTWTDKPVALETSGISDATALAGGDVTHFGKALATFAEKTMATSPDNERLGIAEWYLPAQDLGAIIRTCPRFMAESADGVTLRDLRAAAGTKTPSWVRCFEFASGDTRYTGELWFLVAGDNSIADWLRR